MDNGSRSGDAIGLICHTSHLCTLFFNKYSHTVPLWAPFQLIFRKQLGLSNSTFYPAHNPRNVSTVLVAVSVLHSLTRLAPRMIQISLIKSWSFAKKVKYDNYPDDGSCQSARGKQRLSSDEREARALLQHATTGADRESGLQLSSCHHLLICFLNFVKLQIISKINVISWLLDDGQSDDEGEWRLEDGELLSRHPSHHQSSWRGSYFRSDLIRRLDSLDRSF